MLFNTTATSADHIWAVDSDDLFEITEQQITVLVEKSVDIIRHWSSIVYQAELLTHTHINSNNNCKNNKHLSTRFGRLATNKILFVFNKLLTLRYNTNNINNNNYYFNFLTRGNPWWFKNYRKMKRAFGSEASCCICRCLSSSLNISAS